MARRNHLDDFTRRRMIGKLEEGYCHQISCRVENPQKCRFARLVSVPNHRYSYTSSPCASVPSAIGPGFIFMDVNARPHRTLAVEELLESEDITQMDWRAYSPDLNLIEHVWDALERRIAARLHHPENT
ncbi:transposable element Tcb2 transposase [Trichonephila clavipes]|nr:transposable element Tcb2 transposase [Trichonephila clavipes]